MVTLPERVIEWLIKPTRAFYVLLTGKLKNTKALKRPSLARFVWRITRSSGAAVKKHLKESENPVSTLARINYNRWKLKINSLVFIRNYYELSNFLKAAQKDCFWYNQNRGFISKVRRCWILLSISWIIWIMFIVILKNQLKTEYHSSIKYFWHKASVLA